MGDVIGRKKVFLYCNLFGYLLGGILGYFGTSLWVVTAGIYLVFSAANCCFIFALILQSESLPNEERQKHGLFTSFFISLGGIVFCLS